MSFRRFDSTRCKRVDFSQAFFSLYAIFWRVYARDADAAIATRPACRMPRPAPQLWTGASRRDPEIQGVPGAFPPTLSRFWLTPKASTPSFLSGAAARIINPYWTAACLAQSPPAPITPMTPTMTPTPDMPPSSRRRTSPGTPPTCDRSCPCPCPCTPPAGSCARRAMSHRGSPRRARPRRAPSCLAGHEGASAAAARALPSLSSAMRAAPPPHPMHPPRAHATRAAAAGGEGGTLGRAASRRTA